MHSVLITGAAGFIGSSLADRLLNKNYKIIGLDNFNDFYNPQIKRHNISEALKNPLYKIYEADLEDADRLEAVFAENAIDAVIHLAGRAGVRPSVDNPAQYVNSNVLGTVNLLNAAYQHSIGRFIFASSSSVYGNCPADQFHEELPINRPISPYAATKSAGEQFCYTYHKLFHLNCICLRFFTVYGPRQRPDLAIHKFTRLIDKGHSIPVYGDGSTIRDYTYIDDIINGIERALLFANPTGYEIINLGGGEPINLRRMIKTIETILGKKAVLDFQPMIKGDVEKTVCNYDKAQKLLGYKPQTSFDNGIKKFIEWYKKN